MKSKRPSLMVNQSTSVVGKNYIVVNYHDIMERIEQVWLVLDAQDEHFSEKKKNLNLRTFRHTDESKPHVRRLLSDGKYEQHLAPLMGPRLDCWPVPFESVITF